MLSLSSLLRRSSRFGCEGREHEGVPLAHPHARSRAANRATKLRMSTVFNLIGYRTSRRLSLHPGRGSPYPDA